jgi:MFS family permease
LTEPDVALTDYAVTLECALLTGLLFRGGPVRRRLRGSFALLFASAGIGALAGGTVHGFFLQEDSPTGAVLWRIALLAVGLTALACWSVGGRLLFTEATARRVEALASFEWLVYAAYVLAVDQSFWIAMANYVPAVVFLTVAFLVAYRRQPRGPILAGLVGMVLTLAAGIVQRLRIALHPAYFNHNALYHVIQMTAFALVFLAGRHLLSPSAVNEG